MKNDKRYNKEIVKKIFFICLLVLVFVFAIGINRLILPLGVAYVLALMLRPLKSAFASSSIKKITLISLAFAGGLILFLYPLISGITSLANEAQNLQVYLPKLEAFLREKYAYFNGEVYRRFNYRIEFDFVETFVVYFKVSLKNIILNTPQFLGTILEWMFLVPLFLFFILKDGRKFKFLFLKTIPNSWVEKVYYLFYQFNRKFGDYILAKFIEATIVGVIITSGLLIIDFPFALLLGIVAALTNILPYVGPFLGFFPALIIGLVDQDPNTTLGAMILLYAVANIIDLAIVFPVLVSKIVNLHPIVVVVSVIVGSQMWGVLGMIISIPIAAIFKLLFIEIYKSLYNNLNLE